MLKVGPLGAVPPAISTRPSFRTVIAWPDRGVTRSPTRAHAPDAGSYVEMADERVPSLSPPATTRRPSASATEAAPLGTAISPAAAHVPLATCGTSARRTYCESAISDTPTHAAAAYLVNRDIKRTPCEPHHSTHSWLVRAAGLQRTRHG